MKRTTLAFSILCLLLGLSVLPASAQDDQATKIEEGKRMWEKWIEARGGRDRLSKIREIKSTSEMTAQGIDLTVIHYFKGADKYRVDQNVMGMTLITAIDGDKGWMTDQNTGLNIEMPEQARARFLAEKEKHEELLNPEQYGQTITYEGRKTVEGKEYILLKQAAGNGVTTIHYIDPDTFLRYKFTLSLYPGLEVITSDYRDVDGTKVPFSLKMLQNGVEVSTRTVVEYLYDCGLSDSLFTKP
jgi:hypothetical protein